MSTAAAIAYNYSAGSDAFYYWPKLKKAQNSSVFQANGTYGHCIKDCVLIDLAIGAGGSLIGSGILALLGTIPF